MMRWLVVSAVVIVCSSAAWAEDGAAIYEKKCKICHSIGGVGGPKKDLGGALDDVGSKRDDAWLRAYFKDPKSKIENAKMPKMPLSDTDLDALVKYMLSLKGGAK